MRRVHRCHCGKSISQIHPFACRSSDVIQRHNSISSVINTAARRAGLVSVVERPFRFEGRTYKPDVIITGLSTEDVMSWVDVSICHPHNESYLDKTPVQIVNQRERTKLQHYAQVSPAYSAKPYAAILDVFGRTSKSFSDLLAAISSRAVQNRDFTRAAFTGFLKSELSIALQRGNAMIFEGAVSESALAQQAALAE